MGFNTAAGASLSIGTTSITPLTDSYTSIGNVVNIPEWGRKYKEVPFSPLSTRAVQKVKGSYDEGSVEIELARDTSDAGQTAALVARDVDANYNFKLTFNDGVVAKSASVTTAVASPGQVVDTAHGLLVNTPVAFTVLPGSVLPTGIVDNLVTPTTYYVKTVVDANTYTISATVGGTVINFIGTSTGSHTRTTVPVGSTIYFAAQVASFTNIVGTTDSVLMRKMLLLIESGSSSEVARIPAS